MDPDRGCRIGVSAFFRVMGGCDFFGLFSFGVLAVGKGRVVFGCFEGGGERRNGEKREVLGIPFFLYCLR